MSTDSRIITELIRQGKKLEAVKLLRQATGMDLKRAVEEVERISAASPGTALPVDVPSHAGSEFVPEEVRMLAREGRQIEAIKLLRSQTGMGLKEAKEKVDAIGGIRRESNGCFGVLLLAAAIAGASVVLV